MGVNDRRAVLILVAGAKGAIGSTLALASRLLKHHPEAVIPYLTTADRFAFPGAVEDIRVAGWDASNRTMTDALRFHGVIPESSWSELAGELNGITVLPAPELEWTVSRQVEALVRQIDQLAAANGDAEPVLVNLLPARPDCETHPELSMETLLAMEGRSICQDVVYALAAVRCGVPVVNFTPNDLALPPLVRLAEANGVPLAGRDGKTGQTYFKVVLASALRARNLYVDGWYSLNILGNTDGENLMDPACAAGKLANKTDLLDDILGYTVGERYGQSSHKVHIDYYAPRGDAKEAWDVIDLRGLFGLPMSIRLNLQGRDSILAAPMAIDLARWMAAAKRAGRGGFVPELGFYFKKPEGENAPVSYQSQLERLEALGEAVRRDPS